MFREDVSTEFLLRKNGKPTINNGRCYKDLINYLDAVDKVFDISDDFEKYIKKSKEDSGW